MKKLFSYHLINYVFKEAVLDFFQLLHGQDLQLWLHFTVMWEAPKILKA